MKWSARARRVGDACRGQARGEGLGRSQSPQFKYYSTTRQPKIIDDPSASLPPSRPQSRHKSTVAVYFAYRSSINPLLFRLPVTPHLLLLFRTRALPECGKRRLLSLSLSKVSEKRPKPAHPTFPRLCLMSTLVLIYANKTQHRARLQPTRAPLR